MDLLQTVRKEGSRGGRAAFSWDDVRTDAQRENYLGHSLMAPVGRWQKGKDLGWYAKGDNTEGAKSAEELRREEIRRIKEAEEDALAAALGLPVPDRASRNANLEPLGKEDVIKAATEVAAEDEEVEGGRGVGFGGFGGVGGAVGEVEVMRAVGAETERRRAEPTKPSRATEGEDPGLEIGMETGDGGLALMTGEDTGPGVGTTNVTIIEESEDKNPTGRDRARGDERTGAIRGEAGRHTNERTVDAITAIAETTTDLR
ncbi:hypothetical protein B0A49_06824 [Cryomyces minteri]|uniref:Multiple myeloma tumor-associated protein 2-like N-terminal domain-containing protein n=1 Tax=Cryomyces minteri TaxID=331657 RepID=A0A4U0WSC1_9PEZI|nr:hypothetical protein B0A49_06824 [Cryomyces minteri]